MTAQTPEAQPTEPTKICNTCGEEKPLSGFYRRADSMDGHHHRCKRCDCGRPRRQTKMRLMRVRARHRAQQQLAKSHRAEFRILYEQELVAAIEEADRIEAQAAAQDVEFPEGETARLRKGQRQPDEEAEDRVDTEWCADCVTYHQRGHRPCSARLLDTRVVDLTVLEQFNAGIARARAASR